MKTFSDFEMEVMRVREAINDINIKGERNASLVVYAVGKCNEIINTLHEIANEKNQENKEVKSDGKQDPGIPE